ncbi:phosphate acetyltransferase [Salmonella enterica subsp. enterica]|nr:phosphate acetyltransferase [Salmonella enterica subsp. enterica]
MSRIIMLIPTGTSVGLTSVSLGVIRAMERKGVRLSVFKPIAQPRAGGDAPDQDHHYRSRELYPAGG